ncbi:helix-turn-helix domain-containing protein [uncultured Stenotrophomonas sp.]|uniref:AraC family transcriptional regulator n=1 Tax=uncultured Stenotrophomonas sp. TaxID=165438 RepID=UPI0028EAB2B8|nr:helix-turn-helix domain-containing protein [uncultured Stenotrophomonas sp.]
MPLLRFTDFEAYTDALAGVDGVMRVVGPGRAEWTLELLDAGEVVAMLGSDGAPVLYNGLNQQDRYLVYISLSGSDAAMQGLDTSDEQFIWYPPGAEVHGYSRRSSRFIALSMEVAAVVQRARAVAGLFDDHVACITPVNIGRVEVTQIITLVTRALKIDRDAPSLFEAPSVRKAFSGQIIHALLRCMVLDNPDAVQRSRGRPPVPRNEIIRRSLDHIHKAIRGEAVIGDLVLSAGTSQRSLNRAFDEAFGMGPQQYYMLERLHVIRKALREASPGDTVTSICTRFGVWDQGRFAGMYHRTFGLLPSIELAAALSR